MVQVIVGSLAAISVLLLLGETTSSLILVIAYRKVEREPACVWTT
jgi:hypothetical protein